MANLPFVDAQGNTKYLKAAGAGTDADPQITEHRDAVTLAMVQEIRDRLAATGTASEVTLGEVNSKLSDIKGFTDGLEGLLGLLNGYVDGLEALGATLSTTQTSIAGFVDQVEPALVTISDRLPVTGGASEVTLAAIDNKLADLKTYTDGLEALVVLLNGYVDGLEGLLTTADNTQTLLAGLVDQVEPTLAAIQNRLPAAGTASEATLVALNNKLAQTGDRLRVDTGDLTALTRTTRRKFRDDFSGSALSSAWTVTAGLGQTISVANSELLITAGVTPNSETIIRSVAIHKIPFRLSAILKLSQRIINQEFYFEIVDSTGQHHVQWLLDSTNNGIVKISATNGGYSLGTSSLTISSTASYQLFEVEIGSNEINYFTRIIDTFAARTNGAVKSRQIPDPNLDYYIQIRSKNLAIAPVSNTIFSFDSVFVQETEELIAEITGGRGGANLNQQIPVGVTNSVSVVDTQATFTEIAMPLTANAVQTSNGRDGLNKNIVRGWVFTNVAGTLILEQSTDNTVWRSVKSLDILGDASFVKDFEFKLYTRYFRFRYVNGATGQTAMQLVSTSFSIGA